MARDYDDDRWHPDNGKAMPRLKVDDILRANGERRDASVGITPDMRDWLRLFEAVKQHGGTDGGPMTKAEEREFVDHMRSLSDDEVRELTDKINTAIAERNARDAVPD